MTKILALASQKGGSGKSTLAICVAAYFQRNLSVRIVDADPQLTALTWWHFAKGRSEYQRLEVVTAPGAGLHLESLGREDLIIIDCPGRLDSVLRSAMLAADLLLVPMQATYADAWALPQLAAQLELAQRIRPAPLPAVVVFNRIRLGTRLARRADALTSGLPAGFTLAGSSVRELADFQLAMGQGLTPSEFRPRGAAADDIRALARDLARDLEIRLWSNHV